MEESDYSSLEYTEEEQTYYNDEYEKVNQHTCKYCRQTFACTNVELYYVHSCDMCPFGYRSPVCDACVAWHDCGTTCCKECEASLVFDPKCNHRS